MQKDTSRVSRRREFYARPTLRWQLRPSAMAICDADIALSHPLSLFDPNTSYRSLLSLPPLNLFLLENLLAIESACTQRASRAFLFENRRFFSFEIKRVTSSIRLGFTSIFFPSYTRDPSFAPSSFLLQELYSIRLLKFNKKIKERKIKKKNEKEKIWISCVTLLF